MIIETKESSTPLKAQALEKEANSFLQEKKVDEAFRAFDEAAGIYRDAGMSLNAAICYSLAATCWNIHTGWQPLKNAASRSMLAAGEAIKARHYSYARELFRDAAVLYEKEGDLEKYSECFVRAQNCHLAVLQGIFLFGREQAGLYEISKDVTSWNRSQAFFKYILGHMSRLIWGYGERPARTFMAVLAVVIACAVIYQLSGLIQAQAAVRGINFFEALYFSFVTFATVGYGDYLPVGWVRSVAVFEALAGIFLMSLFLIGLTRRYLRIDR